jgi:hypothetical protein
MSSHLPPHPDPGVCDLIEQARAEAFADGFVVGWRCARADRDATATEPDAAEGLHVIARYLRAAIRDALALIGRRIDRRPLEWSNTTHLGLGDEDH